MTVIGNPRSFHKKFKFIVEIDDVGHAGFQKCSELSVEVANVQYFEGGSLIPNKSPGRLTFSDVTLERGATEDHPDDVAAVSERFAEAARESDQRRRVTPSRSCCTTSRLRL